MFFDEEREDEYTTYNLKTCNVSLRRPFDEEIQRYIVSLATRAQARNDLHLRNRVVSGILGHQGGIFIKENNVDSKGVKKDNKKGETKPKENKEIKIWAKKGSKPKFVVEVIQLELKAKELKSIKKKVEKQVDIIVPQEMVLPKIPGYSPIHMFQVLSQIWVIVLVLEMMRIDGHKHKTMVFINSIPRGNKKGMEVDVPKIIESRAKFSEVGTSVNENLEIYLATTITANPNLLNPFLLSLIMDGKVLRNCMIDSCTSNNVMPIKIMEGMGLKVDSTYEKSYDMDSREVLVIGVIYKVPYRLDAFPEKEVVLSVTVVDIPTTYGMLLSRQWCASMGGGYAM